MPIFSPSSSPGSSSPLQLFRLNKMQRYGVKKLQRRILEQLEDILQVAVEISVPTLKDEEQKEPIERQRLLSPGSERKITQVRNWSKPAPTQDTALNQVVEDAERVMRQKIDTVVRLQNTIRYSEKIRQEWEERVEQALAQYQEDGGDECEGGSDRDGGDDGGDDDHSSTTSEYAFAGSGQSSDPTPMASASPIPTGVSEVGDPVTLAPQPYAPPTPYQWQTRSSTPSSVSSPLALAQPIVASPGPEEHPPPMSLEEGSQRVLHARESLQNIDPRMALTPPLSPLVTPLDVPASRRSHRRHSTAANPILSPTNINTGSTTSPGPISPRMPSAAPAARTASTTIKDFEIIKPISKGAFGSVFLARKKATGDYYAIKVLKKADMIAKNQITNVKAERMILMKQAESPFVAKLFFTFQSKDNLYLVMEYLNGGDCAALIKSLGALPEEWTKNYVAEVVLGLEYLHERGIVHRDLKPDNLLIDQHGHLKLTDFGLSRIGLLGRQTREGPTLTVERGVQRHTRYSPHSRPPSIDSTYLSSPLIPADLITGGSYFNSFPLPHAHPSPAPAPPAFSVYSGRQGAPSYLSLSSTDDISVSAESSGGSDSFPAFAVLSRRNNASGPNSAAPSNSGQQQPTYSQSYSHSHSHPMSMNDSPLQSFATELTADLRSHQSTPGSGTPPGEQKFVGTPDYLAPETILGLRGDDAAVDWWALGVITYEFLYGVPPFHDETPEKVFENILSGRIDWTEEYVDHSDEARDFMERLLAIDPTKRLGANGADEVKNHPFFAGIDWDKVTTTEAAFIPQVTDPESTDYFDPRGAIIQLFDDDESIQASELGHAGGLDALQTESLPLVGGGHNNSKGGREAVTPADDDFGTFSFKNLPVLKQANDDVIRKLRTDQMAPITHTLSDPAATSHSHTRKRSISTRNKKAPSNVVTSFDGKPITSPPSPATSTSSIASSPSRGSIPPSTPGSVSGHAHARKPSEYGAVERFKLNHMDADGNRRNSMPSRLRTASVSSSMGESDMSVWPPLSTGQASTQYGETGGTSTPPSSVASGPSSSVASGPSSYVGSGPAAYMSNNGPATYMVAPASVDLKRCPDPNDRSVTCLLAEDNPITAKIAETLLSRLGCRCVVVADGSEAISVAMGDIKFDCILMDLHMPIVDGESAARYIKSTNNKNSSTPIIAVSAYSGTDNDASSLFAASLSKPLQKASLLAVMRQLGFKTATAAGASPHAHAHGGTTNLKAISVR